MTQFCYMSFGHPVDNWNKGTKCTYTHPPRGMVTLAPSIVFSSSAFVFSPEMFNFWAKRDNGIEPRAAFGERFRLLSFSLVGHKGNSLREASRSLSL